MCALHLYMFKYFKHLGIFEYLKFLGTLWYFWQSCRKFWSWDPGSHNFWWRWVESVIWSWKSWEVGCCAERSGINLLIEDNCPPKIHKPPNPLTLRGFQLWSYEVMVGWWLILAEVTTYFVSLPLVFWT